MVFEKRNEASKILRVNWKVPPPSKAAQIPGLHLGARVWSSGQALAEAEPRFGTSHRDNVDDEDEDDEDDHHHGQEDDDDDGDGAGAGAGDSDEDGHEDEEDQHHDQDEDDNDDDADDDDDDGDGGRHHFRQHLAFRLCEFLRVLCVVANAHAGAA